MDISPELEKQIQACKTEEELIALAAENDVELSVEEAKEFIAERFEGELADEELENVAGGAGCPKRRAHQRVKYGSEAEVQYIFNIGDRPQIFKYDLGGRTLSAEIIERRAYKRSSNAWYDIYKVDHSGVIHDFGQAVLDFYWYRDRFEV